MSSPFTSAKEFLEAKGPIYTFANNSTAIGILLAMSFAIAVYFFYASFAMYRKEKSQANNPALMGVLLMAGLATSLAGSFSETQKKQPTTAYRQNASYERRVVRQNNPFGMFLGLTSSAGLMMRRSSRKRRKYKRF